MSKIQDSNFTRTYLKLRTSFAVIKGEIQDDVGRVDKSQGSAVDTKVHHMDSKEIEVLVQELFGIAFFATAAVSPRRAFFLVKIFVCRKFSRQCKHAYKKRTSGRYTMAHNGGRTLFKKSFILNSNPQ